MREVISLMAGQRIEKLQGVRSHETGRRTDRQLGTTCQTDVIVGRRKLNATKAETPEILGKAKTSGETLDIDANLDLSS